MRRSLQKLIDKTLIYQYSIPNPSKGLSGINISTVDDDAFLCTCNSQLAEVIYNSLIEYSFNEFEMVGRDYEDLLSIALQTKLKYHDWQSDSTKIKYGFYGEVLLYSILKVFYGAGALISRGYFYNPLENSETKGYDSYHLIENDKSVDLWFGEVKFRSTLKNCAKSAIEGLDKALTDDYLNQNILAMVNERNNFNIKGSKIEQILDSWMENPAVNLINEITKHSMRLIYPILLIYPDNDANFDQKIANTINHINTKHSSKNYSLSIPFELFFILMPLSETKKIKEDVITWIDSKKPLLS